MRCSVIPEFATDVLEPRLQDAHNKRAGPELFQAGAELDLLLFLNGRRIGIEIKRADAPKMTPSIGPALEDLELHRLLVVYPGSVRYTLERQKPWSCRGFSSATDPLIAACIGWLRKQRDPVGVY